MGPVLRLEQRHQIPAPVAGTSSRRVPQPSVDHEPRALITGDRSQVEVVHAELQAVQAELIEADPDDLVHQRVAEPFAAAGRVDQHPANHAKTVLRLDGEHRVPDQLITRAHGDVAAAMITGSRKVPLQLESVKRPAEVPRARPLEQRVGRGDP